MVDTTVQEKAIAHPTDGHLLEVARRKVVAAVKRCATALKQTFAAESKTLQRQAGGYAHAKQFKRLKRQSQRSPHPQARLAAGRPQLYRQPL